MAQKKKDKSNKKKVSTIIVLLLALALILYGVINLLVPYLKYRKEIADADDAMNSFISALNETPAPDGDSSVALPGENGLSVEDIKGKVVGIIIAPSIDLQAPVAMGTDDATLYKYCGMFENCDRPGDPGGNTAIAAHSSRYDYFCSFCYFQNIGKLQNGDEVDLLWKDGNTYRYRVYEVMLNQKPDNMDPFQRIDGKEVLTLQTCTDGVHNTRTFVHAERIA